MSQTLIERPATPLVADEQLEAGEMLDQPTFHARYLNMPAHVKAELINGVVHMPSPVSRAHADSTSDLEAWLGFYRLHTLGLRASGNATTIMSDRSEPQPDLSLRVRPEFGGQCQESADGYLTGAPELIVEVAASSGSIDLHAKRFDYETAGVREYAVVLLRARRVVWFVRRDGRLAEITPGPDGILRSEFFGGLWLDPAALFRGDLPALAAVVEQGLASPEHAATVARLAAQRPPG